MIEEIPLNFEFKPKNSKLNYPQCNCKGQNCPKFYWNLLSVASRGSGKTYNIVKLIKHYEQNKLVDNNGNIHPLRTIVISPTLDQNVIFDNLKSLADEDRHDNYSDDLLQSIVDDIKKEKEETDNYYKYIEAYKKVNKISEKKLNDFFKNNPEIYDILAKHNFETPSSIPKPKYPFSPVNIIVLDDLMGSTAFNNKRASKLLNNLIKNRHHGISFAILAQSVKSVMKNVRANCNLFFIGRFASKKIVIQDFWEEISNVITPEKFEELYSHCVDNNQYGSLIIDCSGKEKRFMNGLDSLLVFSDEKT